MKGAKLQYLVARCIEAPAEQQSRRAYAPNIAPTPAGATIAALQSRCQVVTKACIIIIAATWWLAQAQLLGLPPCGVLVLWTM